ncbi:unnamed protein product [Polarella glacialis]|uniref:VOC domain-containing protein n=1 Tax=Polarella glacialis TaxID=89957 RepID=A0A813ER37_POLGL|nr:unnamed protein product [Polarella glacialis]CAE8626308.1 unnamed protein product [Polarella glacialis]
MADARLWHCPTGARSFFLALLAALRLTAGQRSLHWVIRASSLEATLDFTEKVLGMTLLRHEENEAACPITCNGAFDTAWSKTMVGYGPEDRTFTLELTYNYGIERYLKGEGLQRFVLLLPDVGSALARATDRGYAVQALEDGEEGGLVTGPDSYVYELRDRDSQPGRVEQFASVVLRTSDVELLADWYVDVLGMTEDWTCGQGGAEGSSVCLHFADVLEPVSFVIEPTADRRAPRITEWEGRNAMALPEAQIRAISAQIAPQLVIHELRELREKLGTLVILIIRDPAGFEICLVSSETFDPSVRQLTDYVRPNWLQRKAAHHERLASQTSKPDWLARQSEEL